MKVRWSGWMLCDLGYIAYPLWALVSHICVKLEDLTGLITVYLIPESQNSLHVDSAQPCHEVRSSVWMITKASHLEKACSICAICEERRKQDQSVGLGEPADSLEPALMSLCD